MKLTGFPEERLDRCMRTRFQRRRRRGRGRGEGRRRDPPSTAAGSIFFFCVGSVFFFFFGTRDGMGRMEIGGKRSFVGKGEKWKGRKKEKGEQ